MGVTGDLDVHQDDPPGDLHGDLRVDPGAVAGDRRRDLAGDPVRVPWKPWLRELRWSPLSRGQRAVLRALAGWIDADGKGACPSLDSIADSAGYSRAWVAEMPERGGGCGLTGQRRQLSSPNDTTVVPPASQKELNPRPPSGPDTQPSTRAICEGGPAAPTTTARSRRVSGAGKGAAHVLIGALPPGEQTKALADSAGITALAAAATAALAGGWMPPELVDLAVTRHPLRWPAASALYPPGCCTAG